MLFLAQPSHAYKESFLESLREFQTEGRALSVNLNSLIVGFAAYLQDLQAKKDRSKLPIHLVPASDFWLIDNDVYIGSLSLRHELNEALLTWGGHIGYEIRPSKRRRGYGKEILRLGLEKAKAQGIRRVLVTCDEDNIGSKKIIEYNGGKLENSIVVEGMPARKLRYWIDIPS